MKGLFQLLLFSTFASLVWTEVLDFGDLNDYENKGNAPSSIHPDAIWVASTEGGFNIVLGKDIKAKVGSILDGCEKKDDNCFQAVSKALEDAHIQKDDGLDRRQLLIAAATIAEVFQAGVAAIQGAVAGLAVVGSALGINWFVNENSDKGTFWSEEDAKNAAKMPEATPITLSAGGSAVATVTKHPVSSALEGEVTPSVTVVEAASDGFEKGDLAAFLDKNLASRLDEYMQRSKECQVGHDFDQEHPTRKRAGGGTYGQALCAAQNALGGATNGGPFNDLLHLAPTGTHFNFAEAAGPALAAANQMAEFVVEWAPIIAMPEELAEQVGIYVLALAIDTIVENLPLSEKNRIEASKVKTDDEPSASASASGCPDPEQIVCGLGDPDDCKLLFKDEDGKKKAVCEDTDLKDCECTPPPIVAVDNANKEHQQVLQDLRELFGKAGEDKKNSPECAIQVTDIPTELFSSEKMNIHEHFCESWIKDGDEYKMTVDSHGKNVEPEPHLGKRTPPANADSYEDYKFDLKYTPKEGGGNCQLECNDAFRAFVSPCSASSPGRYMYESGKLDVGCGTFEYKIVSPEKPDPPPAPKTKLETFSQDCWKTEDFDLGGDVHGDWVSQYSGWACAGVARKEQIIKKDDKGTFINWQTKTNNAPYQYNVWWKDGCELENGWTEIYAANPLGEENPGYTKCQDSLIRNWKDCTANGGRGGAIQIGCLMFEFSANEKKRESFGGMR